MSAPLFAQISVSLDGYIEDESKSIDWMTEDGSVDALHTRVLSEIDGMIFGRKAHAAISGGTPLFAHRHEFRTFDTQPFASGAVLERFQVRAGSA